VINVKSVELPSDFTGCLVGAEVFSGDAVGVAVVSPSDSEEGEGAIVS